MTIYTLVWHVLLVTAWHELGHVVHYWKLMGKLPVVKVNMLGTISVGLAGLNLSQAKTNLWMGILTGLIPFLIYRDIVLLILGITASSLDFGTLWRVRCHD